MKKSLCNLSNETAECNKDSFGACVSIFSLQMYIAFIPFLDFMFSYSAVRLLGFAGQISRFDLSVEDFSVSQRKHQE